MTDREIDRMVYLYYLGCELYALTEEATLCHPGIATLVLPRRKTIGFPIEWFVREELK